MTHFSERTPVVKRRISVYKPIIYVTYVICILHVNIYEDICMSSFILSNVSTANIYAKRIDIFFYKKIIF
jgi:hypothetical protein